MYHALNQIEINNIMYLHIKLNLFFDNRSDIEGCKRTY